MVTWRTSSHSNFFGLKNLSNILHTVRIKLEKKTIWFYCKEPPNRIFFFFTLVSHKDLIGKDEYVYGENQCSGNRKCAIEREKYTFERRAVYKSATQS